MPHGNSPSSARANGNNRRWLITWGALRDHLDSCGHLPRETDDSGTVPISEIVLANWVRYQRRRKAGGLMLGWQEDLLNQLSGFSWDSHGDTWRQHCADLRMFLEVERRIPRYRANASFERELAAWVHKQRHLYRRGLLLPERVEALRQLPFRIV